MDRKKIIILGKAASGKDYLQKQLVSNGWKPLRQYTTRPKRHTEVGDEYHFVTEEEFDSIIHKLTSVQNFNGWRYGFDIDEAQESDVMIFSPANFTDVVLGMETDVRNIEIIVDSAIIYLDIDEDTRRKRLSVRYDGGNEDDSLERRLKADAEDFEHLDIVDWVNDPIDGFIRLCNEKEVDDFLKKILS
jgi:guanylate kinase